MPFDDAFLICLRKLAISELTRGALSSYYKVCHGHSKCIKKMISTKTTALLAALSIVAAGAIPAAFAANANNQVNLASTEQHAKIKNFGASFASNDVSGDFSGGNIAGAQTNNFNTIDQSSTTTQTNTNTAVSGCTFSAFVVSC